MKSVSGGLAAHLAAECTTLATCWKLTRTDGQVFGFTDYDQDLVVSGVTYDAQTGYTPSAVQSTAHFDVDNLEVIGWLDAASLTVSDLHAGIWDYAQVEIFQVNTQDLTQGTLKLRKGRLGEIKAGRSQFSAELRGMMQAFSRTIGEIYQPGCRATLGDTRCKVRLDPPTWAASTAYTVNTAGDAGAGSVVKPTTANRRHFRCTVAGTSGGSEPSWNTSIGATTTDGSVTWTAIQAATVSGTIDSVAADNRTINDSEIVESAGQFDYGKIAFTSGLNSGLSMEVKTQTVGQVVLQLAMTRLIVAGDTYTLTLGCQKRFANDCQTKFNNVRNFRGEPHLPGLDHLIRGAA